jgi:hypothetical protein
MLFCYLGSSTGRKKEKNQKKNRNRTLENIWLPLYRLQKVIRINVSPKPSHKSQA